jgi:hypothetical protein
MTIREPRDSGNSSDKLMCPRCSASLLPHAIFCSACGERISAKKNGEGEARTENGDDDAHGQEVDETMLLPSLSPAQLEDLQSSRSLKNNGRTGQISKRSSLPRDGEAPPLKDVVGVKLISGEAPESPSVPNNNSAVTVSTSDRWGWLPALSLTSAVGVFLVALAGYAGRVASQWADPLFWLGLFALFFPIALRLLSPKPARRERIALLVILGSALYLVRELEYPLSFAYYDEFIHWRGALDLAASGHLFRANPLLAVGPFYPGLEILTNALSSLTGLSIFISGMIVLGVAGLLLMLALYLFYEYLINSAQMAGIATLLYTANPNFFGNVGFAYESLAIPLAAFVLFAIVRRSYEPAGHRIGLTLAIWLGLAAIVITHHVTSYMLVAFLLLWTITFLLHRMVASFHHRRDQKVQAGPLASYLLLAFFFLWTVVFFLLRKVAFSHRKRDQKVQAGPGGVALLGLVLCAIWLKYTGDLVVGYLSPYLDSTVRQLMRVLTSESAPRQLFHDGSGFAQPLWERVTAFASVGLIVLGLPLGLFQIWRHYRANAVALALAIGALAYPVSQVLRFVPAGTTTGARAQAYLFTSVAFVLAVGVTHFWSSRVPKWRYSVAVTGAIVIIFIGGWILGTAPLWYRLPGPYVVSADHRSIELESVTAAEWAQSYLGPGHRVIDDSVNTLLMATYGNERVVTIQYDKIVVSSVFLSPHFDSGVEKALRRFEIQYIVVDRRLSTGLPRMGFYYDGEEPDRLRYTKPIDPAALAKFDGVKNVSRVFDSGDIVIYDVEAITSAPSTAPTPKPSCTPAPPTAVSPSYPKVVRLYTGTIYDIPTGLTTKISLTGIQQQQGNLCGSFAALNKTGTFKGSITTDGHIQFLGTDQAGQASLTFDGHIQPDGILAGSYCYSVAGKCSDYGIWSLSPGTQGGVYDRRTR